MDSRATAFIQKTRVIVNVYREQARSYIGIKAKLASFFAVGLS